MKKLISIVLISIILNGCMVDIICDLTNNNGGIYDFYDNSGKRFPIFFISGIEAVEPSKAFIKNGSDSMHPRLAYKMAFINPTLPIITINSFSFKRLNGEEIPSIMYYKTDTGYVFIRKFPYTFNPADTSILPYGLKVIAECSESFKQTKAVSINFDIKIDTVRIDTSIIYKRKLYFDWRPKFK